MEDTIGESLKLENFIERTRNVPSKVQETFKKSHANHYQHRIEKTFKLEDRFWLYLNKEIL